jgi:hypothetical protein
MPRFVFCPLREGSWALLLALAPLAGCASTGSTGGAATPGGVNSASINGEDVDGRPVAVNNRGHYTVVMYTNPDLQDESRQMTPALDPFRARSGFALIRVVDLRGNVPPQMRGIANARARAPIIPDFSGSTLDALGWDSTYSQIHLVVYDEHGKEIKRLADASDPQAVAKTVGGIL